MLEFGLVGSELGQDPADPGEKCGGDRELMRGPGVHKEEHGALDWAAATEHSERAGVQESPASAWSPSMLISDP